MKVLLRRTLVFFLVIVTSNSLAQVAPETYLSQHPTGALAGLNQTASEAQPELGLQLQAVHVHAGFGCTTCDTGPMTVSAEGIEFHGTVHQFNWKKEQVTEVKDFNSAMGNLLFVKVNGQSYKFRACTAKGYSSDGDKCALVDPEILAKQITATFNGEQ
jgi:hypothetical protein